jgi:hypothetical protein
LIESDEGDLTSEDLLFLSFLLADVVRRAHRSDHPETADRHKEMWEKLQPAVRRAQGWTRKEQ